jgi:hypothetical protein
LNYSSIDSAGKWHTALAVLVLQFTEARAARLMRPSPADWAGGQDLRIGAIPVHMSINYILGYFSIGVIDQLKVNDSIDIEMSML